MPRALTLSSSNRFDYSHSNRHETNRRAKGRTLQIQTPPKDRKMQNRFIHFTRLKVILDRSLIRWRRICITTAVGLCNFRTRSVEVVRALRKRPGKKKAVNQGQLNKGRLGWSLPRRLFISRAKKATFFLPSFRGKRQFESSVGGVGRAK